MEQQRHTAVLAKGCAPLTPAVQSGAMRSFDVVITIDWSAASAPKLGRDSIWFGLWPDHAVTNVATRHEAARLLSSIVDGAEGRSVLVACDFSFGYPAGTAAALQLDSAMPPWLATWTLLAEMIDDRADNTNNRFEVAAALNERMGVRRFWGAPAARASDWLTSTKPPLDLEFRAVELAYRERGLRPASCWQLLGAGSVGSQSLTGIPILLGLRRRLPRRVTVWPFEPIRGVADEVVVAEVWPSELPRSVIDGIEHPVADARQVIALSALLGHGVEFREPGGETTSEEGWVLSTIGL